MIGDVFGNTPVVVERHECPTSTPWGRADTVTKIADGIYRVDTPGHGGYWLSRSRNAVVRKRIPLFKTFAGGPWYEEDCDWAVVVAAFPECFKPEKVEIAKNTIRQGLDGSYFFHATPLLEA